MEVRVHLQDTLLPFRAAAQQKVLLVDDDPITLEILSLMLGTDGHDVRSVQGCEAALHMLNGAESGAPPDVLLVDMHMPGMPAAHLAERVRAIHGSRLVLLAMSATTMDKHQLHGFDGFLQKPFTIEDLRGVLQIRFPKDSPPKSGNGISHASPGRRRASDMQPSLSKGNTGASRRAAAGTAKNHKRRLNRATGNPPVADPPAPGQPIVNQAAPAASIIESTLDRAVVEKLSRAMPAAALKELYDACIADSRVHAKIIEELARSRQLDAIPPEAHRIKGAALMVGASHLASAALSLEWGSCKSEDPLPLVAELHRALERLERILQADELGKERKP